jgi:hypothetical protein
MTIGYLKVHSNWANYEFTPSFLSLLRCGNKHVVDEATETFYRKNTFSFLGEHEWEHIAYWLTRIGKRNHSYLSKINIEIRLPQQVWQTEDGSRIESCMLH